MPDIAIIAPGLLGASLGAASRKLQLCGKIHVWARRSETRETCKSLDWCDIVHDDISDAVKEVDLVWVCSPVSCIARLIHQFAPSLKSGAIVTDVGSTKHKLVKQCEQALGDKGVFVGSHPMAGSEKSGLQYATTDLYRGKSCFVTPHKSTPEHAIVTIEQYWVNLGMQTVRMDPLEHDRIVAHISHLPHLVVSTLSAMLYDKGETRWKQFVGSGLLDTTRVASGSVDMWKDIVSHNREEILPALSSMIAALEHLRVHVESGHPEALVDVLNKGKEYRESIEPVERP